MKSVKLLTNLGQNDLDRLGLDLGVEDCLEGSEIKVADKAADAIASRKWGDVTGQRAEKSPEKPAKK